MTDPQTRQMIQRVAAQIADLRSEVATLKAAARTSQLQHASITDTAITVYGPDGQTPRQYVGAQGDGTVAVVAVNGPPPPAPSAPQVFPTVGGLSVGWDGLAVDEAMPADFDHVDVHTSATDGFTPSEATKQGTLSRAGLLTIAPLDQALTYVRLVAVSTSGTASEASEQDSGTPAGAEAEPDTTVPGVPQFTTPTTVTIYRDGNAQDRARLLVTWTPPAANTDGSPITDGSRYEIQYRVTTAVLPTPARWADIGNTTWGALDSWGEPLSVIPVAHWAAAFADWGDTSATINELGVGLEYELQIRAVDTSGHASAWSSPITVTTIVDTVAPSTPAAPQVAGSKIAIGVTHSLARDGGQPFSLESDLHHLEVHVGVTQNFTVRADSPDGRDATAADDSADLTYLVASDADAADLAIGDLVRIYAGAALKEPDTRTITAMASAFGFTNITIDPPATAPIATGDRLVAVTPGGTKVGEMKADSGLLAARIPVVGTFPVDAARPRWVRVVAVDTAGNKSNPSPAATATAELIDDEFIANLNVSKLLAGELQADIALAARIIAGDEDGARVELGEDGLLAFAPDGTETVRIASADGSAHFIGEFSSGPEGERVVISPVGVGTPEIRFYSQTGENVARIRSYTDELDEVRLVLTSGAKADSPVNTELTMRPGAAQLYTLDADGTLTGGKMEVTQDYSRIGYQDGTNDNFFWFNNDGATHHIGKWYTFTDLGSSMGLFTGHLSFAAENPPAVWAVSYGATMAGTMVPVVTPVYPFATTNLGATPVMADWGVSQPTATGFNVFVNWARAFDLNFWCFRI